MATLTTYGEIGIKEDISDIITNISPTATPFTSGIGTYKCNNILVQWMEDQLNAVGVNSSVEGFVAAAITITPPVMRNNVTQIFSKTIAVSGTEDAVDLHGRDKASAYNMALRGKEIKRDLEYACIGTKQLLVNTSASVARTFNGVQAQIPGSTSTAGSVGNVIGTGAAATALSEANLVAALQLCYVNGSEPNTVLVTPTDAVTVASFAQAAGKYRTLDGNTKTVTNAVTLYASPFGDVKVTIDRFLAAGDSLVYEPDMFKLIVLRNWQRVELAKVGDATNQMIVGEFSLKHAFQAASALIRRQ